jgi:hypothetical protein
MMTGAESRVRKERRTERRSPAPSEKDSKTDNCLTGSEFSLWCRKRLLKILSAERRI